MSPRDIVRAAIPDASDSTIEHVIWERTPFPMTRIEARTFYKAASGYARACRNGLRLCDHCSRIAMSEKWECSLCRAALDGSLHEKTGEPG